MANSQERATELGGLLSDIKTLEESETVYYVNSNYEAQADGTSGETRFDSENNRVMINVAPSYGLHGLAHELTHGIQFENGSMDFSASSGGPGFLYDATDEVQAFRRQYAVKPGSLESVTLTVSSH